MSGADSDSDRRAVIDVIEASAEAWRRGDAVGYGDAFTDDASYVTFVGTTYQGRADIVEAHRALFARFLKGTRVVWSVTAVRFYGADAAVVLCVGDTAKGKREPTPKKVQTYTMVRDTDGRWRIAAFHNTERRRLMEWISFRLAPATIPADGRAR